MTNKQIEEVIEELASNFIDRTKLIYKYHDDKLREEGFNPSNSQEDVRLIFSEILTQAIKEAEERVVKRVEDNIKSNIGALTTSPADPFHHSIVAYIKCCKWWEDAIHKSIKESK